MKSIIQHFCLSMLCLLITVFIISEALHNVFWAKVFIEGTLVSVIGWAWWIFAGYSLYMMFYVFIQLPILYLVFRYVYKLSIDDILKEIDSDFFMHSM
jgi:hypothetical protein